MIPCPSCPRTWSTEETLAVHMIDTHGLTGPQAAERARASLRDTAKIQRKVEKQGRKAPMGRKLATVGTCGYCKAERPNHKAYCRIAHPELAKKRKAVTRRHPKPPRKAPKGASRNGSALSAEIAALGAVTAAMEPLEFNGRCNVLACVCKLLLIDPAKLSA